MLEHFIWIPEVTVRLSNHYTSLPAFRSRDKVENTKFSLDLARAVARTKSLNAATGLLGLLQSAMFDLAFTPQRPKREL